MCGLTPAATFGTEPFRMLVGLHFFGIRAFGIELPLQAREFALLIFCESSTIRGDFNIGIPNFLIYFAQIVLVGG